MKSIVVSKGCMCTCYRNGVLVLFFADVAGIVVDVSSMCSVVWWYGGVVCASNKVYAWEA